MWSICRNHGVATVDGWMDKLYARCTHMWDFIASQIYSHPVPSSEFVSSWAFVARQNIVKIEKDKLQHK